MRKSTMFLRAAAAAGLAAALLAGCGRSSDGDAAFEAKRRAMLDRIGPFIYNTDGCEMFYYPGSKPITAEAFKSLRLDYAKGTQIRTVSYCPLASGFGFFTVPGVGEYNTRSYECKSDIHGAYPRGAKDVRHYNAAPEFERRLGTDAVRMALDWGRENGCQTFVSVRFNDTHDQSATYGHVFFPPFKAEHPECLMGATNARPKVCSWTAVDFAHPLVRERMRGFVRQFFEKYDMDGFEIDFFRHVQIFKSVADGGVASEEELGLLTDVMAYVRETAEEFGRKRGHPILIAIRTPDSVGYCRAVGIDLETWFRRKLVDVWTSTGYFQHEQWPTTVAYARRHGVRCYASMDESRIPGFAKARKYPIIPGRESVPNYRARFAAAFAAGCDGLNLFNMEYGRIPLFARDDPRALDGKDKLYFATERGSGGYRPYSWLVDGDRFNRMPQVDPAYAHELASGVPYGFEMMLGDDFAAAAAKGAKPRVTVRALPDAGVPLAVTVNGHALKVAGHEGDILDFAVDPAWLVKGLNAFSVVSSARNHLHDFAVRITYDVSGTCNSKKLWGYMLHMTSNNWSERPYTDFPIDYHRDQSLRLKLHFDEGTWNRVIDELVAIGANTLLIDVEDGLRYDSHPEIAVEGSWPKEKMRAEVQRLRKLGFTLIPKLNFSATHDTWLKGWQEKIGTLEYRKMCGELIDEVCDVFDHPKYFHIGTDEETEELKEKWGLRHCRSAETWWTDVLALIAAVERNGARTCMWESTAMSRPDEFLRRCPRSVVITPTYSNYERITDVNSTHPTLLFIRKLTENGFDVLPGGSNWNCEENFRETVAWCEKNVDRTHILGYLMLPWQVTLPAWHRTLQRAVNYLEDGMLQAGAKEPPEGKRQPFAAWVNRLSDGRLDRMIHPEDRRIVKETEEVVYDFGDMTGKQLTIDCMSFSKKDETMTVCYGDSLDGTRIADPVLLDEFVLPVQALKDGYRVFKRGFVFPRGRYVSIRQTRQIHYTRLALVDPDSI